MKKYVIAGNGAAAANCIEGIRSIDSDGSITVISEEKHEAYCRPLISYYLENKTVPENMGYRKDGFYQRMKAAVLYGQKAVHIHKDKKTVGLDNGEILPYDALCLAVGSSPFIPKMEGLENVSRKHTFMTLDDALSLEQDVDENTKVLIIGAGLIGLKCAEGISGRTKSITVCDLADRVLSSILDAECASMMQRHLEKHGMRFLLGDSVSRFDKDTAIMKSGTIVDFDVLVLAVGVRPNTALLKEIGGEVNRGMLVNSSMETSIEGIYAAGDCTESEDLSSGTGKVLAILPNAAFQGFVAGVNMAGGNAVFDKAIPMNSIGFFGLHAMTAGTYAGKMYEEKKDSSIKRLYTEDDRLKGFVLIGCDERAGIYTSMIREQTPLSSVDFELMKKNATTAAFSRKTRTEKFGRTV